jgi:hypothetical protein
VRQLLREGRVRIPDHPRLVQQIREVQGRPLPGGGVSVTHPRWRTGGHGDLCEAWALAVYQLAHDEAPAAPMAPADEMRERRRAAFVEAQQKAWWRRGR